MAIAEHVGSMLVAMGLQVIEPVEGLQADAIERRMIDAEALRHLRIHADVEAFGAEPGAEGLARGLLRGALGARGEADPLIVKAARPPVGAAAPVCSGAAAPGRPR